MSRRGTASAVPSTTVNIRGGYHYDGEDELWDGLRHIADRVDCRGYRRRVRARILARNRRDRGVSLAVLGRPVGGGAGGGGDQALASGTVTADMQGTILSVEVSEGDEVVCVLEAMKMENNVVAPTGGTVTTMTVSEGDTVDMGDALIVLE